MKKILLVLLSLIIVSCAQTKEGPSIYFSNVSAKKITDIESNWAGKNLLSLPILRPGDTRSQPFNIKTTDDFFGEIRVSWNNAAGKRITREFMFNQNNLPSISDPTIYSYVQFYLDQDEFEILSSDAPDLPGKIRKMDRLLKKYSSRHKKRRKAKDHTTSLITIEAQEEKTKPIPAWLGSAD